MRHLSCKRASDHSSELTVDVQWAEHRLFFILMLLKSHRLMASDQPPPLVSTTFRLTLDRHGGGKKPLPPSHARELALKSSVDRRARQKEQARGETCSTARAVMGDLRGDQLSKESQTPWMQRKKRFEKNKMRSNKSMTNLDQICNELSSGRQEHEPFRRPSVSGTNDDEPGLHQQPASQHSMTCQTTPTRAQLVQRRAEQCRKCPTTVGMQDILIPQFPVWMHTLSCGCV